MEMKKLRRAVIKEELVAITDDFREAVILNQFIYWTHIKYESDVMVREEIDRYNKFSDAETINYEPSYGWIYKTAEDLATETMMKLVKNSILKYINNLVSKGYLYRRRNPKIKWDRTYQYRLNVSKLNEDLKNKGYQLDGFKVNETICPNSNIESANDDNRSAKNELGGAKNELHNIKKCTAIPKTTTKITTENKNKEAALRDRFSSIWSIYPRKQEKEKSFKAYCKAIKDGVTDEEITKGIQQYNSYITREKVERKYIKMGSTYFNGRCWEDEYEEPKESTVPSWVQYNDDFQCKKVY